MQQQQQQQQQQSNQQQINARYSDDGSADDRPASDYRTSEAQFADLHNRLQFLNHATSNVHKELSALSRRSDSRHQELLQNTVTKDQLSNIETRLQRIEQALLALQRDAEGKDYRNQFAQLHKAIETSHLSLTEALQTSIFNSKFCNLP